MSCFKCIKRLFCGIENEEETKPLYVKKEKYKKEKYNLILSDIDENNETSSWSLKRDHNKSKYIRGFNSYLIHL